MEKKENQQTENALEIYSSKIKSVRQELGDIQINTLINPNTLTEVICITQSNKTIFLEIDKLKEFLIAIEKIK
ncbi:MAG TPA: hypothetical protein PK385_12710 [Spirochaetota bacterium]|nr:hypothetical protein [Spirochaetota bacterium]